MKEDLNIYVNVTTDTDGKHKVWIRGLPDFKVMANESDNSTVYFEVVSSRFNLPVLFINNG